MAGPAAFAGRAQTAPSGIAADLDQVLIRIQAVDGFDGPAGAALGNRPLHYLDPVTVKLGYDLFQRPASDEAEIPRPHLRPVARLLPGQLQIDLLVAKAQRPAPLAKGDGLHVEHSAVKRDGPLYIAHRQYQMVDMADHVPSWLLWLCNPIIPILAKGICAMARNAPIRWRRLRQPFIHHLRDRGTGLLALGPT
jgi:hypothetical protein